MSKLSHDTLRRKIGDSRVGRSPIVDIDYVCEQFGRQLEETLRAKLQTEVKAHVDEYRVTKMGPALDTAEPSAIYGVTATQAGFCGAAIVNPTFAFRLIEVLTGVLGPAGEPPEGRELTLIDEALLTDFVRMLVAGFEHALLPDQPKTAPPIVSFTRFLRNRASILEADDDVDVLNIRVSIAFAEGETPRSIDFFTLFSALDVIKAARASAQKSKTAAVDDGKDNLWSATMLAAANAAEFRMVTVLAEKSLSLGEIRELKPGAVLPLPVAEGLKVDLRIDRPGGVVDEPALMLGALGAFDGQRAVRLTEAPDDRFLDQVRRYSLPDQG